MKSAKFFASLLLLICSLSFFSCSKQNEMLTDTQDVLTQGQWKVDYLFTDQDRTTQFVNYSFSFYPNGTLYCSGTNGTESGSWRMLRNVNGADYLEINLPGNGPELQQLNTTWKISTQTFKEIEFNSDSQSRLRIGKF